MENVSELDTSSTEELSSNDELPSSRIAEVKVEGISSVVDEDVPYKEVKHKIVRDKSMPKYKIVDEPQKLSRIVEHRITQKYLQEHCRKNDLYMTPRYDDQRYSLYTIAYRGDRHSEK